MNEFLKDLENNVILSDGSISTMLIKHGLPLRCNMEMANLDHPDIVRRVHQDYLDAGVNLIKTNTFGANRVRLSKYGLEKLVKEINAKGVRLARESIGTHEVYVAASIGPLGINPLPVSSCRDNSCGVDNLSDNSAQCDACKHAREQYSGEEYSGQYMRGLCNDVQWGAGERDGGQGGCGQWDAIEYTRRQHGDGQWDFGKYPHGQCGGVQFGCEQYTEEQIRQFFREQLQVVIEEGADVILLETFTNLYELRLAVQEVKKISQIPIIASMYFRSNGRTPDGVDIPGACKALEAEGVPIIGMNHGCAPLDMARLVHILRNAKKPETKICIMPSLGGPKIISERNIYLYDRDFFELGIKRCIEAGVHIIGGCCGVTPDYIRDIRKIVRPASDEFGNKPVPDRFLKIFTDRKELYVRFSDILYICSQNREVFVHTTDRVFKTSSTLNKLLEEELDSTQFIRVHKSYIINREKIDYIQKETRNLYKVYFKGCGEDSGHIAYATHDGMKKLCGTGE